MQGGIQGLITAWTHCCLHATNTTDATVTPTHCQTDHYGFTKEVKPSHNYRCRFWSGSSGEPGLLGARPPLALPPCTHSSAPLPGGLESVSTTRLFSLSMELLLPGTEGFRCTCTFPLAVSSTLHAHTHTHTYLSSVSQVWLSACSHTLNDTSAV